MTSSMPLIKPNDLLSQKQAAAALGVSVMTIYRWVHGTRTQD